MRILLSVAFFAFCGVIRSKAGPHQPAVNAFAHASTLTASNADDGPFHAIEDSQMETVMLLDLYSNEEERNSLELMLMLESDFSDEYLLIWSNIEDRYVASGLNEFVFLLSPPDGTPAKAKLRDMRNLGFTKDDIRNVRLDVQNVIYMFKDYLKTVPYEDQTSMKNKLKEMSDFLFNKRRSPASDVPDLSVVGSGHWNINIDASHTENGIFYGLNNKAERARYMYKNRVVGYGIVNERQVIAFRQKRNNTENDCLIYIILSNNDEDYRRLKSEPGKPNFIEELDANLSLRMVDLYLLKFEIETKFSVNTWARRFFQSRNPKASPQFSRAGVERKLSVKFDSNRETNSLAGNSTSGGGTLETSDRGERIVFKMDRSFLFVVTETKVNIVTVAFA